MNVFAILLFLSSASVAVLAIEAMVKLWSRDWMLAVIVLNAMAHTSLSILLKGLAELAA